MADYSPQWHHYRVLNRAGLVAFVGFIGALPVSIFVDRFALLPPSDVKTLFIILAATALVSLWVLLALIMYWRCPRCHEWFSRRRFAGWPSLRRHCVHCGLKLYADASHDG